MKYTKEILELAVKGCYSISQVCRNLGIVPKGGNISLTKKRLLAFGIDISNFAGQAWTKEAPVESRSRRKLEDILQKNVNYSSDALKNRLILAGLKEYRCERCKETTYTGVKIPLQLHHINQDHYDNRLENLQLVCPTCHAIIHENLPRREKYVQPIPLQKVNKEKKKCTCLKCGKEFQSDRFDRVRKFCSIECYREYVNTFGSSSLQKSNNSTLNLENIKTDYKNYKTITALARAYNVYRGTIREFLIKNNLYELFKENSKLH